MEMPTFRKYRLGELMKIKLKNGVVLPNNWKSCKCSAQDWADLNSGKSIEVNSVPKLIENAEVNIREGLKNTPAPSPKRTGSREANIKKELDAFDVMDGFEVSLFADERHGIANPLSVRWDARGRMFVACSDVYPQIEPGVMPDDKVIMLEDKNTD